MRRFLLAIILLATNAGAQSNGSGGTMPATCVTGDAFYLATIPAPAGWYDCVANAWVFRIPTGLGDMLKANNLGDVASVPTSRTNLGLAAMATVASVTLTGDVTGSGTNSFAATVAANAITNAKAAQMANATFKCRNTAGTGNAEDCTVAQVQALLKTPISVRLAADSALSTTTKTNLTGMSFTLAANTNYSYQCRMYNTANAVTVGVQFTATFGGTVTATMGMYQGPGAATTLTWISDTSFPQDWNPTASQGNVAGMTVLSGTVEVSGTGGTLQFQHASETATLTTVQRGSWCQLTTY